MSSCKAFKPKLRFKLLAKYIGAKYSGRGWIQNSDTGKNVNCNQCGNIANAVIKIGDYLVPICKPHFEKQFKWQPPRYGFISTIPKILERRNQEPEWQIP
jgi:hypothetical protein